MPIGEKIEVNANGKWVGWGRQSVRVRLTDRENSVKRNSQKNQTKMSL